MTRLGVLLLALLLAGCATGRLLAPLPQPTAESATLIVVRPSAFTGGGASWPIALDGQVVAELGNDEYVVIPVNVGEHVIGPGGGPHWAVDDITSTVVAKPGETYYFRMSMAAGFFTGMRAVTRIDANQGREAVAKMKRLQ